MAIDATVREAVENAEIEAAIAELRKQHRGDREDLSSSLLAQLTPSVGMDGTKVELTTTATVFTLWNRDTGEPSQFTYDTLGAHMRIRFDSSHPTRAGELVWTANPMQPKVQGNLLCPLHPRHPDRALADSLGLGHVVCRKHNLMTQIDVERHVEKRHPALHERLKRKREDDTRDRQMAFMARQTEAMERLAGISPTLTSTGNFPLPTNAGDFPLPTNAGDFLPARATGVETTAADVSGDSISAGATSPGPICPECGWTPARTIKRPAVAMRAHRRVVHQVK